MPTSQILWIGVLADTKRDFSCVPLQKLCSGAREHDVYEAYVCYGNAKNPVYRTECWLTHWIWNIYRWHGHPSSWSKPQLCRQVVDLGPHVVICVGWKTKQDSGTGVFLSDKRKKWLFPLKHYTKAFQASICNPSMGDWRSIKGEAHFHLSP